LGIAEKNTNQYSIQYRVISKNYKDQVVITHHHTKNNLQVQGKPLFFYRNISYFLSVLLDQQSLFSVINRASDEGHLLVREDVATIHNVFFYFRMIAFVCITFYSMHYQLEIHKGTTLDVNFSFSLL
jgi:hypothetical protein